MKTLIALLLLALSINARASELHVNRVCTRSGGGELKVLTSTDNLEVALLFTAPNYSEQKNMQVLNRGDNVVEYRSDDGKWTFWLSINDELAAKESQFTISQLGGGMWIYNFHCENL